MKFSTFVLALVAGLSIRSPAALAQTTAQAGYVAISGGAVFEPSEYNVRGDRGFAMGIAMGRQRNAALGVEAGAGFEHIPAPLEITTPGGCLGRTPCTYPSASDVNVATLGRRLIAAPATTGIYPMVSAGGGLRYASEEPEAGYRVSAHGEVGFGFALAAGSVSWTLETRFQRALLPGNMPPWTLPLMIGLRF